MTKKQAWGWALLGLVSLIGVYGASRLINLTSLPIFTDEAIYIRWSQIGARDPNWRFISLTDGKQPMFTWVMMAFLRLFEGLDPLFVGRLVSVASGLVSFFGVIAVSYELFQKKAVAWVSGALYVALPFTLWYDRMALYDSMVVMFSIISLYVAIRLVRTLRLDMALILGLVLGFGMLNKTSGFLSLYLLPATLVLFDWKASTRIWRLVRWIVLVGVAAVLSQIVYSVLRLSPFFHIVAQKNNVFVFTLSEWMDQPFRFLAGNLRGMFDWTRHYMTLPVFLAALIPIFTRWKHSRERMLLYLWWVVPFVGLANFAKILYPRFILFMCVPIMIVAAHSMVEFVSLFKKPVIKATIILLLFAPAVYISYVIVRNPMDAPIPLSDRYQYIDDWPAGEGIFEVVSYLSKQAESKKVYVVTEGTFGLLPYALEIYLVDTPNITIQGIWPLPQILPESVERIVGTHDSYLVINESQEPPSGWPLTLIGEYQKGRREDRKLRFYHINTPLAFEVR